MSQFTLQEELVLDALTKNPGLSDKRLSRQLKIPVKEISAILQRPVIQKAIKDIRDDITGDSLITVKRIIEEELHLGFYDHADQFGADGKQLPIRDMPERFRRAIVKMQPVIINDEIVEYAFTMADKGKALERLEKHFGFFEADNQSKRANIIFIRADEAKDYIDVTPDEEKKVEKKIEHKPITILD